MNNSIKKLIKFLKILFIDITPNYQNGERVKLKEYASITSVFGSFIMWYENEEPLSNHNIVLDEFAALIAILHEININNNNEVRFTDKDFTNIIMYTIKKNIENKILDESKSVTQLMESSYFHGKEPTIEDIILVSMQKNQYESYKCLHSKYINTIPVKKNEIHLLSNKPNFENINIRKGYKILNEYYFDKINTFTEEDVEIIINALNMIGNLQSIEESIRTTLLNQINSRTIKQKQIEIKRVERVQKPILTKKEYHEIKDELDRKFDFERMEPLINVTLTPEEIEHCINLMNQLSFTDREKEIFLEKSFKKTREELLNIDSIMILLKNQIEFYNINNETVNKAMENLELYIEEYKNVEDIIDKEEWLGLIKDEIRIVNTFIPKTFEYEKSMLLQKRVN